jgi:hypothetical protein
MGLRRRAAVDIFGRGGTMSQTAIARPDASEYPPYYERYVSRVPESDLLAALAADRSATLDLLRSVPESRADDRYEPGKWSIREVVQHVLDAERVFGFRAFWFARNPGTSLPGFEQDGAGRDAAVDARLGIRSRASGSRPLLLRARTGGVDAIRHRKRQPGQRESPRRDRRRPQPASRRDPPRTLPRRVTGPRGTRGTATGSGSWSESTTGRPSGGSAS